MESNSLPGRIQISRTTYERVYDLGFVFEERKIEVKGKGSCQTYLLDSKHHESAILTAQEMIEASTTGNETTATIPVVADQEIGECKE